MSVRTIFNSTLSAVGLSHRPAYDGGDIQRVEAHIQDDLAVAMTAGNARFTLSTTTVTLSSKLPNNGEEYVWVEAQVADVTYWDDAKDPATTPGGVLSAGYAMRVSKALFTTFKMVRASSTDAIVVLRAYKPNLP